MDLGQHRPAALRNPDLEFVPFSASLADDMDSLVGEIFRDYANHYQSNPYLAGRDLVAGYREWVGSFSAGADPSRAAWLIRRGDRFIGFCSCADHAGEETVEGVLYGVVGTAAGAGVYGDMIRFTQAWCLEQGRSSMRVSTQVENFAVQKVWVREGFHMTRALDTVHVNAFLSHSEVPKVVLPLRIDDDKIRRFASLSGDANPIHLDDAAGAAAGFRGRIAHGVLVEAELSRVFGTLVPGAGSTYLSTAARFLAPIYPDEPYTLLVGFPWIDRAKGLHKAVAQVRDGDDRLCFLAYGDLLVRQS